MVYWLTLFTMIIFFICGSLGKVKSTGTPIFAVFMTG